MHVVFRQPVVTGLDWTAPDGNMLASRCLGQEGWFFLLSWLRSCS
uniref:Predicted protein n=1 Tax=Hordeum vulgare subsp. vulgare TaxID=112509 RepID=F2EHN0_HORVV|nr:predicted protein [Hordeum vulgare subsp. vulgare]